MLVMAWEWVAPVATGMTGIAGVGFTWWAGHDGRQHAERVATQQIDATHRLATEQRQQERIASAYVELLTMVERTGQWAAMVRPIFDTNPPAELPALPDFAAQAAVQAYADAFASQAVLDRFAAWREAISEMIQTETLIRASRQMQDDGIQLEPEYRSVALYKKMQELRPKEYQRRKELADEVAMELGHRRAGGVQQQSTATTAIEHDER